MTDHDQVTKPSHYAWHPSGIQPIEISEWCSFNIGTAINYIWRHAHKGQPVQDLRKAAWHLRREANLVREHGPVDQPEGPRDNFHIEDIIDGFSVEIQAIFREIWDIGRIDIDEYSYACLKNAALLCDQEAERLEESQ